MDASSLFKNLLKNLDALSEKDGRVVVKQGKFIGTNVPIEDNMIQGSVVSEDDDKAKIQKKFEDSVLGVASFSNDEEKKKVEKKYVEKLIKDVTDLS